MKHLYRWLICAFFALIGLFICFAILAAGDTDSPEYTTHVLALSTLLAILAAVWATEPKHKQL